MPPAGQLRNLIEIQHEVLVPDGMGGQTSTWVRLCRAWADIQQLGGYELLAQQQVESRATVMVVMHWRPDVTPQMRVIDGSQVYLIQSVADPTRKRDELNLMCVELSATSSA